MRSASVLCVLLVAGCGGKTSDDRSDATSSADTAETSGETSSSDVSDGTSVEVAPDVPADAPLAPSGSVVCGSAGVCELATHTCCYKSDGPETGTPSCVAGAKCPGTYDHVVRCEKRSDCAAGEICCGGIGLNGNLMAGCAADCGPQFQRCADTPECKSGLCNTRTCGGKYLLRVCGDPKTWCA